MTCFDCLLIWIDKTLMYLMQQTLGHIYDGVPLKFHCEGIMSQFSYDHFVI